MHAPALRPLAFGEILDGAFVLYRRNFTAFLALSALPVAPLLVCQLALAARGTAGYDPWGVLSIADLLLFVLASGALIRATADAYGGDPVDVRAAFAAARARYWLHLRVIVVTWLIIFVGLLLLIVPGIVAMVRYFAVQQVAMLEDTTASGTRHRSERLADGAGARIGGMMAVLMLIYFLPAISQEVLAGWFGNGGELANPYLGAAIAQAFAILALPLTTAAYTLLYFDRRIRAEGMDVEMAMRGIVA